MSKIAIISQPDQGILVDISGCVDLEEAREHLVSSLEVSSQLPEGTKVDLKLGAILLNEKDVDQIVSLAQERGIAFNQVFANNNETKTALKNRNLSLGTKPLANLADEIEGIAANTKPEIQPTVELGFAGPGCESVVGTTGSVTVTRGNDTPLVLYLKQNLRSGQSVSHNGHLIIFGDVNPGAEVNAEGDITVWGALRGVAHAGVKGNTSAEIRAIRLNPIQLRIAHAIARAPDRPKAGSLVPETARIVNGQIRIQANIPE